MSLDITHSKFVFTSVSSSAYTTIIVGQVEVGFVRKKTTL